MRKNIVAGNWKMNKTLQEGIALAKELNEALSAQFSAPTPIFAASTNGVTEARWINGESENRRTRIKKINDNERPL